MINTDDYITESCFLLRTASIAVRGGLSEDIALRALTSHAAAGYRQKVKSAKNPEEVETNPRHQAVPQAMERRIDTLIIAQRADDLVTGLRLAREYDLRAVLGLAAEAYLVPDQIKNAKLPVVLHPTMQRAAGTMETLNSFPGNAAVLAGQQIPMAISSGFEGYVPKCRLIRHEAAMAMVQGLGFEKALAASTIDAAKILRIDDRYGSLDAGKVPDLVLYDGHPFESTTHVTQVITSGRLVYDRSTRPKLPLVQRNVSFVEPACCLSY